MIASVQNNNYDPSQGVSPVQITKELGKVILEEANLMLSLSNLMRSMLSILEETSNDTKNIKDEAIKKMKSEQISNGLLTAFSALSMAGTISIMSEAQINVEKVTEKVPFVRRYKEISLKRIRQTLNSYAIQLGMWGTVITSSISALYKIKESKLNSESQKLDAINKEDENFVHLIQNNSDIASATLKRITDTIKQMIQNTFKSCGR